ncbi:MAG: molybdopterin molybdenumtransferase MoeA [Pirellulaceae bacterium]|nr:MAG: molybdopterin molybdenumtransferase MoeA [Pirellulaceae bacterium]
MIEIEKAQQIVLEHARALPAEMVSLWAAAGRVLCDDVTSDSDSPPFDKALMDGYAVRAADAVAGAELDVAGSLTAGQVATCPLQPRQAVRIMTGAPVPTGADAVVMFEHTEAVGVDRVRIRQADVKVGQNILPKGASMKRGEMLLPAGRQLRPIDVGLLAEVGQTAVRVTRKPEVAILATGDELVEPEAIPQPGQIRNSNAAMLAALASTAGADARSLGIARDEPSELERLVRHGLASDVLLLTGGVSMGDRDYVPQVLERLAVRRLFHGVNVKPGKPIWCGLYEQEGRQCWVFGLPGNPVSSLVCFELFVRPALDMLCGRGDRRAERFGKARLAVPFEHRADRVTYYPATASFYDGQPRVRPLNWKGSADLRTLADATALLVIPSGTICWPLGEEVGVYWLPSR